MADEYVQRTVQVKHKKDEGKIKRWVVNPIVGIAKWKVDEEPKRKRVSA